MFKKILIANRGEVALRIIFACRELDIKTVAVYSEADENSLHVRFADEDVCIGPARSADSYLNVPAVISAAEITGADAIHPGYGFLSESAYLAEVCEACHIKFIGPDPQVIRLMGDKARARRVMRKAGVPMLPGSDGPIDNDDKAQKLVEESPSPALSEKMRRKMGGIVIDAAKAVQYTNAGTFEFLMDPDGRFYFMEANTRLQVEHPVTEMVTGIDIVKEQIRIAAGERLAFKQSEVTFTGHSIECRVNAEDPETFVPSPGVIHVFSVPGGPGVRVETFAHSECTISPYYDSMIAKLIVHGRDRHEAIARMKRTLEMTVIEGIKTTIPLHVKIMNDPDFVAGKLSTAFMDRFQPRPNMGGRLAEAV